MALALAGGCVAQSSADACLESQHTKVAVGDFPLFPVPGEEGKQTRWGTTKAVPSAVSDASGTRGQRGLFAGAGVGDLKSRWKELYMIMTKGSYEAAVSLGEDHYSRSDASSSPGLNPAYGRL